MSPTRAARDARNGMVSHILFVVRRVPSHVSP